MMEEHILNGVLTYFGDVLGLEQINLGSMRRYLEITYDITTRGSSPIYAEMIKKVLESMLLLII